MCVCVYQRMDSKNSFPFPFLEWLIEYSLHVHWVELRVVEQWLSGVGIKHDRGNLSMHTKWAWSV